MNTNIPLIPAKAGTQAEPGINQGRCEAGESAWIPAFAGTSGERA
jgi:hypothetical protein